MTGTFFGEFLDLSAMFLISALMLTFEAKRFFGWSRAVVVRAYFALAGTSIALLAVFRTVGIPLFVVQITGVYLIQFAQWRWRPGAYAWARAMGAVFLVGFGVWSLDIRGIVCSPTNHLFTGHSFWHLASAASLYCYYRYQAQFFGREDEAFDALRSSAPRLGPGADLPGGRASSGS